MTEVALQPRTASLARIAAVVPALARAASRLRVAAWLDRERAVSWSGALAIYQALLLAGTVLWSYGTFGPTRPPILADFMSFYGAGKLALSGTPQLAYDHAALWHAEQIATGADTPYNYFFYPPPFLALCAALACFPYLLAFILFETVTLCLYLVVVLRILGKSRWVWCLPALAFPSVFWTMGLGQTSFLIAALFGAGTLLVDRRPWLAGGLLGLLGFKPHFGLLVPLALAAGRRWVAFASASAALLGLVIVSLCVFGIETWCAYFVALGTAVDVYTSGKIILAGYVTPFGAARLIGLSTGAAYAVQFVIALATACYVAWIWYRDCSLPVRASVLIAGTLLSIPLALVYDLLLAMVCIAWLVRSAQVSGFLPWERLVLSALYVIPLVSLGIGLVWRVPLGPVASAAVLALCFCRVSATRRIARANFACK
jgi:hypothetical protein